MVVAEHRHLTEILEMVDLGVLVGEEQEAGRHTVQERPERGIMAEQAMRMHTRLLVGVVAHHSWVVTVRRV